MISYQEFLAGKKCRVEKPGRIANAADIHPMLHQWQNELVQWAVRTGRAALWADTGMGKTVMQLEWARLSGNKPSYWRTAVENMTQLESEMETPSLFDECVAAS